MSKQTIVYQPAIENKRIDVVLTREIKASPGSIFPLACPVEELRWIPEWEYDLIYSKSGVNETGCIFNEGKSGPHFFEKPLTTTWVTTVHDPDNHLIVFQLYLAGKAMIRFNVRFREVGRNVSSSTWQMVFTALDEEANAMPDETVRLKLEWIMTFLAEALQYYCEKGEMVA